MILAVNTTKNNKNNGSLIRSKKIKQTRIREGSRIYLCPIYIRDKQIQKNAPRQLCLKENRNWNCYQINESIIAKILFILQIIQGEKEQRGRRKTREISSKTS
ncbi:unnamed protein product (macronuclear) [Paramecium tetraurelia]|uniref:Uncharacterized protein n=1 Tax=Paramecium tetraurelia TaxID=5888 RepID=A0BWE5_PARTE|nr:uncharacterized protein GSPATT00032714001 [Paramecium tetraurelia]CAK62862.1 unnamed protein product [Paramecium tetraurelia]|eukprot:XP_001430260.1 hypothetical protein (macronuclear) [Paramecium tetraurelia strain d4-2]